MDFLNDFLIRALIAAILLAAICGPLGCFVVWRRLAYFGDTLSHATLLGLVLSLATHLNVFVGVLLVTSGIALVLFLLEQNRSFPMDSILGLIAHSALALGLIGIALLGNIRINLMGFLFGDILSVSKGDLAIMAVTAAIVLLSMLYIWRPLLAITVNSDLAAAEGIKVKRIKIIFMFLMAVVIALAIKIVGVLLITSMLIINASAARNLSKSPEQMGLIAILVGILASALGLFASNFIDLPTGPSIVVGSLTIFILSLLFKIPIRKIIRNN